MSCCPATILSFVNESASVFPYTSEMQAVYGSRPYVEVVYRNEAGAYQTGGVAPSQIVLSGGNINVDHGGPATGLIIVR